jgi:hypothetical protein
LQSSVVRSGLKQAINYFFRIIALNALGTGRPMSSIPSAGRPLPQPPSEPSGVLLNVINGKLLEVLLDAPLEDEGGALETYQITQNEPTL